MKTPKVLGLSGFGMEVPDLGEAERFYTTFGLEPRSRDGALRLGSPGREHDECILVEGSKKRFHHVSFFIDPREQDAFADKLTKAGFAVKDEAPQGWQRPGLWFQDPWGTWIHLSPESPSMREPGAQIPSNLNDRTDRVDVHLWRELDTKSPPRRIGHMLLFTQEWEKAEAFFVEHLGMRTADRAAGKVTFMAAGEGVIDHHCFGLINATHRGFQHASFHVSSFDDIGFGAWRMNDAGYKEAFGPGRHAIASNLFHYVRDPWGSWVEYYTDMDKISEAWQSRDFEALPYIWGPEWSPEFWNGEMNANLEPSD